MFAIVAPLYEIGDCYCIKRSKRYGGIATEVLWGTLGWYNSEDCKLVVQDSNSVTIQFFAPVADDGVFCVYFV